MNPINSLRFYALLASIRVGAYFSDTIDASSLDLTNADAKKLIDTIKANKTIRDKIIAIDLSENEHLTQLEISGMHNLRSITVDNTRLSNFRLHNLPALRKLSAAHCNLSYIDLSSVTDLETLNLPHNRLAFLDISGFKNLINAYVQQATLGTLLIAGSLLSKDFYYDSSNFDNVTLAQIFAHRLNKRSEPDILNLVDELADNLDFTIQELNIYCSNLFVAFKFGVAQQALSYSARVYALLRSGEFSKQLPDDILVNFVVDEYFKPVVQQKIVPNFSFAILGDPGLDRNMLLQQYIDTTLTNAIDSLCTAAKSKLHKQVCDGSSALARAVARMSVKQPSNPISKCQTASVMMRSPLLFITANVVEPMLKSLHSEEMQHSEEQQHGEEEHNRLLRNNSV